MVEPKISLLFSGLNKMRFLIIIYVLKAPKKHNQNQMPNNELCMINKICNKQIKFKSFN